MALYHHLYWLCSKPVIGGCTFVWLLIQASRIAVFHLLTDSLGVPIIYKTTEQIVHDTGTIDQTRGHKEGEEQPFDAIKKGHPLSLREQHVRQKPDPVPLADP